MAVHEAPREGTDYDTSQCLFKATRVAIRNMTMKLCHLKTDGNNLSRRAMMILACFSTEAWRTAIFLPRSVLSALHIESSTLAPRSLNTLLHHLQRADVRGAVQGKPPRSVAFKEPTLWMRVLLMNGTKYFYELKLS